MKKEQIDIYKDLIHQYHNLTVEEQRAILIYKSQLFHFMNAITSVSHFENLRAEEIANKIPNLNDYLDSINKFKTIIELPENMTIRYTVFDCLKMDDYLDLIDSLKEVYHILLQAREKIILEDDLVVYRGVSLENISNLNQLSRGNIISTSVKLDDAEKFLFTNSVNVLYIIKIHKGIHALVSPISLIRTYQDKEDYLYHKLHGLEPTLFKLMNRGINGQQEVILFRDDFQIREQSVEIKNIGDDKLIVVTLDTVPNKLKNCDDAIISRGK